MKTLLLLALSSGLSFTAFGCSSDEVDKTIQCADICSSYVDCGDNTAVTFEDCNQSCEDFPGGNTAPAFETCEDCLDNKPGGACEGETLNCESECAPVYAFIETGTGA